MRPPEGLTVSKLQIVSQGRIERVADWIRGHADYAQLNVALTDILGRLAFQVKADKFEQALDELSRALGFAGERPDKEWKEGPDNLWAIDDVNYIVWECKNEVQLTRAEINKSEAEQMNRSAAWFTKHYPGCKAMHTGSARWTSIRIGRSRLVADTHREEMLRMHGVPPQDAMTVQITQLTWLPRVR